MPKTGILHSTHFRRRPIVKQRQTFLKTDVLGYLNRRISLPPCLRNHAQLRGSSTSHIESLSIENGSDVSFSLTSTIAKPRSGILKLLQVRFRGRWASDFIASLMKEGTKSDVVVIAFTENQLRQHHAYLPYGDTHFANAEQSDCICFEEGVQCWMLRLSEKSATRNVVDMFEWCPMHFNLRPPPPALLSQVKAFLILLKLVDLTLICLILA